MSPTSLRRLLPVIVQEKRLLIDATQVVGVEDGERVQQNPSAGPPYGWLLGSTDGPTVFDLATILGLDVLERSTGSVVVLSRSNGELWGLLVDVVERTLQVPEDEVLPLAKRIGVSPYSAVAQIPDAPTLLLAVERLHADDAEREGNIQNPEGRFATLAEPVEPENPVQQMLWVSVDSEHGIYAGFSSKQIVEICDLPPIASIPGAELPLTGIAAYDGQGIPVADLGHLLDVTLKPSAKGRLLVARCTRSARRIGLPIFGEVRLVDLPVPHRPGVIPPEKASWIRGSFLVDKSTLMVPDLDSILE